MENSNYKAYCNKEVKEEFITKIIKLIGPVIVGAKPAELLSFSLKDKDIHNKKEMIDRFFTKCNKVSFIRFTYKNKSEKVMFYNPTALDNILKDKRNLKFLVSQGYPAEYNLDSYLKQLISKMELGDMPHELGTFLGYPLKDVIGFMGHPSLRLTKVRGWRVYGNPKLSDERFQEFLKAKDRIKIMLQYEEPHNILLHA